MGYIPVMPSTCDLFATSGTPAVLNPLAVGVPCKLVQQFQYSGRLIDLGVVGPVYDSYIAVPAGTLATDDWDEGEYVGGPPGVQTYALVYGPIPQLYRIMYISQMHIDTIDYYLRIWLRRLSFGAVLPPELLP
jgi:hypothetical protein